MINSKRNISLVRIFLGCLFYTIMCSHSGRTDSKGGHYNRSTGEYHYHNGVSKYNRGHNDENSGIEFLVFGGAIGILILVLSIKSKIDERNNEKKRLEKLEYEKERKSILDLTLKKYEPNYNLLLPLPDYIRLGELGLCKFCRGYITKEQHHIKFLARTNYHSVCISCAKKNNSLGFKQPIEKFKYELEFAHNYTVLLELLIKKSNQFTQDKDLRPNEHELKDAFLKGLKSRINK